MALDLGTLFVKLGLDSRGFSKSMGKAQAHIARASRSLQGIGIASGVAGAGLTLIGTKAVKAFGGVESAVNNALTLTRLQGDEFKSMQQQMTQLSSKLSTTLGVDAADIATGFYDVLSTGAQAMEPEFVALAQTAATFAKVVGIDMSSAVESLNDTLKSFGLNATQAGAAADVFFVSSQQAATTVPQLVDAMREAGPAAKAAGISLNEAAAVLAALADKGTKGAKAGTALRIIMTRLAAPPADAAKALDKLGVSVFNADGSMRKILDILEDVQGGFKGMSDQQRIATLKALAGEEAFSKLAGVLDTDINKLREWTKETARGGALTGGLTTKMSGFEEQMNVLKARIDAAVRSLGAMLLPTIRKVGGAVSGAVTWFIGLDKSIKETIVTVGLWVTGIAAGIAALSALGFVLGPVIAVIVAAFSLLAAAVSLVLGPIGIVIAAIGVLGFAAFKLGEVFFNVGKDMASSMLSSVDVWATAMVRVINMLLSAWDAFTGAIRSMMVSLWSSVLSGFQFFINAWLGDMGKVIQKLADLGVPLAGKAAAALKGFQLVDAEAVANEMADALEKAIADSPFGGIVESAKGTLLGMKIVLESVPLRSLAKQLGSALDKAPEFAALFKDGIARGGRAAADLLKKVVGEKRFEKIKDFLAETGATLSDFMAAIAKGGIGAGGALEDAGATIAEAGDAAASGIVKAFSPSKFGAALAKAGAGLAAAGLLPSKGEEGFSAGGLLGGSRLGQLTEAGAQGGAAGGPIGAAAAVGGSLLMMSEQFEQLSGVIDQIVQLAANTIGAVLKPLGPILGAAFMLLNAVLTPLVPLIEALLEPLEAIAPIFVIIADILGPLLSALVPIVQLLMALNPVFSLIKVQLKLLFGVLRILGIVLLTFMLAITKWVINPILKFVGMIVAAIANAIAWVLEKIAFILGKLGFGKMKERMEATAAKMRDAAEAAKNMGIDTEKLEEGLETLKATTFDDAADRATDTFNDLADAGDKASKALTNVPQGFKVAQAAFDAIAVEGESALVPSAAAGGGAGTDEAGDVNFNGDIIIQSDGDPILLLNKLVAEVERRAQQATGAPVRVGGLSLLGGRGR